MVEPAKKKRKLPSLDDSFDAAPRRSDSPDLHQGRKRTTPHVEGQWAAHVYLDLESSHGLRRVLKKAFESCAKACPPEVTVHPLLDPPPIGSRPAIPSAAPTRSPTLPHTSENTLHLSLSRPLMLQTNQRAELRAGVAKVAGQVAGFSTRYASFVVLENDQRTRRFLGIEIGQGYDEMHALVRKIDDMLATHRLPTYYPEPRFHTSLAWSTTTSTTAEDVSNLPFDDALLVDLEAELGKQLRREGEVWAGELCVKIGKDVSRYRLSG
ncbi:UPF0406 family protein [Rhodotorula toruloides]|uniref:U6 snRNA phosphodiesterase 1 n=1 Tax=Rhodotorula toruloides TaxID=5286 RepID=A0A511KKP2_RHOTO|nr:UPF0406 family protein [Rhodotorula toruloides]